MQIFKEGYEKMQDGSVQIKLSPVLLRYQTTPHSMTKVPPAELLMKRRLHTQLNRLVPSRADCIRTKQSQKMATHNYYTKEMEILEDHVVYAKDSQYKKAWMQGTVMKKTGPVSAQVQLDNRSEDIHLAAPRPCLKP